MAYHRRSGLPKSLRRLADLCRACFAGDEPARPPRAIEVDDWPELIALARRHRVESLAAEGLRKNGMPVPPDLSAGQQRIVEDNLRAADDCARIAERFASAGLDLLFVKGLTLSALAYGDPFLKQSNDIDLLIDTVAIETGGRLLGELGYRCIAPRKSALRRWHSVHKESLWMRDGRLVELHHRLADNPTLLPGASMALPRQKVAIAPGLSLPTLGDAPLLAYLAVHGASSLWFRLKWLSDFAALSKRASPRVRADAGAHLIGRALVTADALAADLFAETPVGSLTGRDRLFVAMARRELAAPAEPVARPLGTLAIRASALLVANTSAFAFGEALRQMRAMMIRA